MGTVPHDAAAITKRLAATFPDVGGPLEADIGDAIREL